VFNCRCELTVVLDFRVWELGPKQGLRPDWERSKVCPYTCPVEQGEKGSKVVVRMVGRREIATYRIVPTNVLL
jgi:hypothetical protein